MDISKKEIKERLETILLLADDLPSGFNHTLWWALGEFQREMREEAVEFAKEEVWELHKKHYIESLKNKGINIEE